MSQRLPGRKAQTLPDTIHAILRDYDMPARKRTAATEEICLALRRTMTEPLNIMSIAADRLTRELERHDYLSWEPKAKNP